MKHEIIKLKEYFPINTEAFIEVIIPFNDDNLIRKKSPGIIIIPGGAYSFLSVRESDPVAFNFSLQGYITFVLHYSIKTSYPTPMLELAYAFSYLKDNAEKYYLDKNKLGIIGFSAGGHLVSSYGYLYSHEDFSKHHNLDTKKIRPSFIISSYPVITMKDETHFETRENITKLDDRLMKLLSVEDHITPDYPPTFVWTTRDDTCVKPINSLLFVEALKKNNIRHEFFYYQALDHGLSIISPLLYDESTLKIKEYIEVSTWFDKAINFINKI